MKIPCKVTRPDAIPYRGSEDAAGHDLIAVKDTRIFPHQVALVPTGCFMAIPKGHHGKIFLRSSTGLKTPLRLANQVGIIDSDYRGEIMLPLENVSDKPYMVFEGDRLCQIIIEKNITVEYETTDDLSPTKRDKGGFGSTTKRKNKNKENTKENE